MTDLSSLNVAGVPTMGMGGLLPFTGQAFFVNASTGSDGNDGSAATPFATLGQAQTKAVANRNDMVFVTGTISLTSTLAWAKDRVHLIGLTSPSNNPRARLSASGTVFTPMVNVTAQGCIFANLGTFYGFADASAQVCWLDAGQRNYYKSVSFQGMGATLAAAHVGGRSLVVGAAGQGEHVFEQCVIGLDTITRSAANASLEFLAGSPRNTFRRCVFPALTSSATAVHVTIGADGIDRWVLFEDCSFINCVKSGGTGMTVAMTVNAAAGGLILLQHSTSVGATKWGDAGGLAQSYVDGGAPVAATSNLGINPA